MKKEFMDVFITNALLKMSIIDQKYWTSKKPDTSVWHDEVMILKNEIMEFIASSEPKNESEVV